MVPPQRYISSHKSSKLISYNNLNFILLFRAMLRGTTTVKVRKRWKGENP